MNRSFLISIVALAALTGCGGAVDIPADPIGGNGDGGPPGSDGAILPDGAPPTTTCEAKVVLSSGVSIAELRSKVALPIEVTMSDTGGAPGGHPLKVELIKDGKTVKTLVDVPKGESLVAGTTESLGKATLSFLASEAAVTPGTYGLKATLGCPTSATNAKPGTAEGKLHVVRLGAARIDIGAGDGEREPLMYHAVGGTTGNYFPITDKIAASSLDFPAGSADLDTKEGVVRLFPEPWADLDTPKTDASGAVREEGATYPVSLKVATKPDVTFTIGKNAGALAGPIPTGLANAELPVIRLVLDGETPTDTTTKLTEGGKVVIRLSKSPVPSVDKYDVDLKWHFEAKDDKGAWVAIPGATQSAKIRLYGVLGNEMLGTTPPNLPWVAVVDGAVTAVGGKASDAEKVRAALTAAIYESFTLKYDRKNGASYYTSYTGGGYLGARFELASFLKRSRGNTVNCTDCASILSTYSSMIGAKLRYSIIGFNFSLNPILGIGGTTPGSPFDSGRMGFSYHAVTSHDAAKTINDATLALDGDADAKTAPFTKLLVQNISGSEYLTRLSPGAPEYKYVDQNTTVR